ncbi:hypothetical protein BKA66DRAFT_278745 [Pyrenochaeta sp. MPI-SDFR-AT-0127]|nr:hypothetical protein BKA66DRAFT_278745 [Pyrenochaeta sp. MPI-SDFR-AT-0127]
MSIVLEVATATVPFMAFTSNVVETGFKVSRFLAELADAPAQIRSLRDFVDENTLLADAYYSYLEAIGAHHGTNATGSEVVKQDRSQKGQRERMRKDGSTALKNDKCGAQLSSAIGALSRELKILDQLSLKHSKIGRSWRNFQFVLEKRQVAVAITNLERTKFILISGLTIANSQLSTLEHWNIEDTVQKCSEKMTSRVNALRETLLLEMRDQHRIMQRTIQQHNESVLGSKLNKYGSSRGHAPSCLSSKQQQDQLVLIRKQLSISNRNSIRRHNETRSLLVANRPGFEERISSKIAHLHEAITNIGPNITKESGNVIHYMGDRRDMVVAYLLPLRAQLDSAIEIILTQRPTRIPPCYIIKLRSRFQHLVASATQEEAARHPMSTASSFDRWLYGLSKRPTRKRTSFISTDRYRITRNSDIDNSADAEPIEKQHERPNLMTVAVEIDSGLIRISILPQSTISISDDEYFDAHLNFIPRHHKSSLLIDIRFAEVVAQQTQPKLHVQLNAFNVVDLSEYDQLYRSLFRDGSIKDVDSALRTGKVSPYHVSICGINLCIYVSCGRHFEL